MKGKKYTRGKLSEWLSLPDARIHSPADATPEQQLQLNDPAADFVVILGADADVPKLTYADSSTYDSSGAGSGSDSSSDSGTSSSPRRTYAPEPADSAPVITATPEPAATDTPEPVPDATADAGPTATPLLEPPPLPVETPPQTRSRGH